MPLLTSNVSIIKIMIRTEAIPFIFESLPYVITIALMTFGVSVNDDKVISLKKHMHYIWHSIFVLFILIWGVGKFGVFNGIIPEADRLVSSYAFSAAFGLLFLHKVTKKC